MANAKIYSLANFLSVDEAHLQVPQNVRLVLVDEGQEPGGFTTIQTAGSGGAQRAGYKTLETAQPQQGATAYIIIVDTKIGDETPDPDFPITFSGIKPIAHARSEGGVTGYTAYKFDLATTETIQAGGIIPLDISAFGDQMKLDISNPSAPDVSPLT